MKFRNLVFLFTIILILLAWFTKPDYDDFVAFHEEQDSNLSSPPIIKYTDAFLFSQVTVIYYHAVDSKELQKTVAVAAAEEKYIGLFGKFWSLN
ncbi:MAG: hypothetical protein NVV59_05170 [Chitinophagaceae bacterium]|nr:hypothetical protein [Chitinophagaceae bacterium]